MGAYVVIMYPRPACMKRSILNLSMLYSSLERMGRAENVRQPVTMVTSSLFAIGAVYPLLRCTAMLTTDSLLSCLCSANTVSGGAWPSKYALTRPHKRLATDADTLWTVMRTNVPTGTTPAMLPCTQLLM